MDDKRVSTPQRCQACSVSLLFMSSHLRGIIGIMCVCLSNLIGTKNTTGYF
jgi:hypothetical protein